MTLRRMLLTAALGAAFLFAGAGTAEARDNCRQRINKEERKLQRDIRKHGWFSRQAQHRREHISRLRSQCGGFGFRDNRHGRWDRDRDWDRNHDRYGWRDNDRRRRDRDWRDDNRRRDRNHWFWDGRNWRRR